MRRWPEFTGNGEGLSEVSKGQSLGLGREKIWGVESLLRSGLIFDDHDPGEVFHHRKRPDSSCAAVDEEKVGKEIVESATGLSQKLD